MRDQDDVVAEGGQQKRESGGVSSVPSLLGRVRVTVTYEPFKIGLPFVPFPDTITRSQTGTMQNIATLNLPGCNVAL